jgi:hypothetical protein
MPFAMASSETDHGLWLCNEMIHGKVVLQTVIFSSSVELYLPEQLGASKDVYVSMVNQKALRKFLAHYIMY